MADFLTRLAGRTLGLAATVQPMIAPMYAAGHEFVGAEDAQEGVHGTWGARPHPLAPSPSVMERGKLAPTGGYDRREMSVQVGMPDEAPSLPGTFSRMWEGVSPGQPLALIHLAGDYPYTVANDASASTASRSGEMQGETSPQSNPATPALTQTRSEDSTVGIVRAGVEDDEGRGPLRSPSSQKVPGREDEPLPGNLVGQTVQVPHSGRRERPFPTSTPPLREESEAGDDGRRKRPFHEETEPEDDGRRKRPYPTSAPPPPLQVPRDADVVPVQRPPAPAIQVTIGRIEVRATPPPPAPRSQPQRSGPAVMSLEEYLNQRAKGGY